MMAAVLSASFVSCTKELNAPDKNPSSNQDVKFNISVADLEPQTKAMKSGWVNGDKLNIWFSSSTQQTPDLVLTHDGTKWITGALRDGVTFVNGATCYAIYEGFNDLSLYTYSESKFSHNIDISGNTVYQCPLVVRSTRAYGYDEEKSTVSVNFNAWTFLSSVQIVVTGLDASKASKYTMSIPKMRALPYWSVTGHDHEAGKAVAGLSNSDGVAFLFARPVSGSSDGYNITLTDYTGASPVQKTFSKTATIPKGCNSLQAFKIPSGSFH